MQMVPALEIAQLPSYSYLLGMYLGDGCISADLDERIASKFRCTAVRKVSSPAWPAQSPCCVRAIRLAFAVAVASQSSTHTPTPGRYCFRSTEGDESISGRLSWSHIQPSFFEGASSPNGCRHRRIVAGCNYPAYSFTNHSADILRLFTWACELIGLHPRRTNRVTVSLARRVDVAAIDQLLSQTDSAEPCLIGIGPSRRP